jgi:hypothetical protein
VEPQVYPMYPDELTDRCLAEWVTQCRQLAEFARNDAKNAATYDALTNREPRVRWCGRESTERTTYKS